MANQDFVLAPTSLMVDFVVDPVVTVLHSFQLINLVDMFSGFDQWVTETRQSLSPEVLNRHKLVMDVYFNSEPPSRRWPSFPDYLDHLETVDAMKTRDESIKWMADCCQDEGTEFPGYEALLSDVDAYIDFLRAAYAHKVEKGYTFEEDFHRQAFEMLTHPEETKAIALQHAREMWDMYMADEWTAVVSQLEESAAAYREIDYSGLTYFEIIEAVTGRDLREGHADKYENVSRLIFVPSPHIGPYVGWYPSPNQHEVRMLFAAKIPKGSQVTSPALSRAELLIRLNALADDTRLQIMELLAENEEMCAQDFINLLGLSQSSASRHLRQLTASGYLTERRREVAKCYSLNNDRINDTVSALHHFLKRR